MENAAALEERESASIAKRRIKTESWRSREQQRHLKRQLAVTDKLLDVVDKALADERELYRYIQSTKSAGAVETLCEERELLNEERLAKLVKALSDLIGIQHEILAVPLFKEKHDADNTRAKLESDRDIALRKIELELMKTDGGESHTVPEQLLAALGGDADDP